VPSDVIDNLRQAARGEMAIEDGIRCTYEKFAHVEVRGPGPLP